MKTPIKGTPNYSYKAPLMGEELILKAEPNNIYDSNAVAIYNQHGEQVGYIPKERTLEYHKRNKGQQIDTKCFFVNKNGKMIIIDIEFNDK